MRGHGRAIFFKLTVIILSLYRVIFLTGPPLKMSLDWPPPNLLGLAPPLISLSVGIMLRSSDWPPPVLKKF